MVPFKIQLNILLLVLVQLFLASVNSLSQNQQFGKLTVEDGLSNSFVNCLLQDSFGFIWFGTDDGLNRFDGYDIKVYRNIPNDTTSLSGNVIWSLFEDREGFLWIGTKTGKLNRYDPYNDRFENWFLPFNNTEEKSITYITQDKNNFIWIGTYRNGLYRFDSSINKFAHWQNLPGESHILSSNYITSILEDDFGKIWVATFNGIDRYEPDNSEKPFSQVFNESEKPSDLSNIPVWYLNKSSFFSESILAGTLNGLIKFNPVTLEYSEINFPENLTSRYGNSVSSVAEEIFADEKMIWIGTYGGLVRYSLTIDKAQRFIQSQNDLSGLLSNQVHDMIIDKSGVVWIATENGINYCSPKRSKFNFGIFINNNLLVSDLLQNRNIRAIAQTENETIWFGTEKGLFGLSESHNNSTININPELQSLNIWSLFNGSSNNLWIGTYGQGLKELDLKTNTIKSWQVANPVFNAPSFNYVKTILQDDEGFLWVGFWGGGLARLNPANERLEFWRNESDNSSGLSNNDVWMLFQDSKGRIWIGTNGGGLNLFNKKSGNSFYHWKTKDFNKESLSNNNVYTICEAINGNITPNKTVLWIGTAGGLNKLIINDNYERQDYNKPEVEIKYFTVGDGLPDNAVEIIVEDEKGNLWIGTSSGISFFDNEEETFTNYGLADGLNGNSFNSSSAIKTKDGIMFFGSTSGLNYFDPKNIKQSNYSPPVVIIDFQIHNQPSEVRDKYEPDASIYNSKNAELSYYQNDFSFQFASLDYNAPDLNQYAYFMEGFDNDWIYSGKRRFVTYTNLDPGEYVFQVKATNSDGLWSQNIAKIFIVINPPFWKTWWAYTIYVIAFIGGLYFMRKIEIKRRKKKEAERLRREREKAQLREAELKAKNIEQEKEIEKQKIRNRIAQDLHDEIGSNLSSISLMSELIQIDGKINPEAIEKIYRIQKVAKGSTQAMRDIVWLTNPSSDNIKDLVSKMNEVANDLLGRLKWNFDFPPKLNELNLLPETKRNVFFIYKETLNNIVKHSGAENILINLKTEENQLILEILDDGKGFDTNVASGGNGLRNMQNRAKEIGGKLELNSNPGKGTKLVLEVIITQVRD